MSQDNSGWDVDASTMTATHKCGLVIQYRPSDDGDGLVGFIVSGQEQARELYSESELTQMFEASGHALMTALYKQPPANQRLH